MTPRELGVQPTPRRFGKVQTNFLLEPEIVRLLDYHIPKRQRSKFMGELLRRELPRYLGQEMWE